VSSAPATPPLVLPAPAGGAVDLLIVAGEHSGDQHAARVVRGLRARHPGLRVCALGGPALAAAGAQLLRDLTAGSTMGFAVLANLSYYRALIAEVVRWVGEHRPKVVCFVDSSGLNLRIAKGLFARGHSAKAGGPTKTLYYISPQIWASRAGRRFEMARHLDGLAAIFPFEPAVYADTALPVDFVGHPFLSPDYRAPVAFDPAGPVLLLPGSRRQVVSRVFPLLVAAYEASGVNRPAVALYPSEEIRSELQRGQGRARSGARIELRPVGGSPVAAAAVLTVSGTMSLECALAGIPGALTYRTDPLTYFLGRLLVKVEYIGIANLLLKEPMYPEFIQGDATADALAGQLRSCLQDAGRLAATAAQSVRLRQLLGQPTGGTAADWLGKHLGLTPES
jgi:lipid-A-disaccharide synthase